jgi:hypothetical protein
VGKWISLPSATTTTAGIAKIGHGLQNLSPGNVSLVVSTAQLWVDANGNDTTGDGSQGNPFATLTHTFAFIVSNPLANGYQVFLPPTAWQESVGLPPSNTVLIGLGNSSLSGPSSAALTWTESTNPGVRAFRNLALNANVTGAVTGDLELDFIGCSVDGTFTLVGTSTWVNCESFPTFANCQSIDIVGTFGPAAWTPPALSFTYNPEAGTNGSNEPGLVVEGGRWSTVVYNSTDESVPLYLMGCEIESVQTNNVAVIRCRNTRVLTQLYAQDVGTVIEYDQEQVSQTPSVAGFGSFILADYLIVRAIAGSAFSAPGNLTIPIPKLAGGAPTPSVLFSSNLAGTSAYYVSNTNTTLTIYVVPGTLPNPAFSLFVLLRP